MHKTITGIFYALISRENEEKRTDYARNLRGIRWKQRTNATHDIIATFSKEWRRATHAHLCEYIAAKSTQRVSLIGRRRRVAGIYVISRREAVSMETIVNERIIIIKHRVEDSEHIVEIHAPIDWWQGDHLSVKIPVAECDAVEALWVGYNEAVKWGEREGFEFVRVMSTDAEAQKRFGEELAVYE